MVKHGGIAMRWVRRIGGIVCALAGVGLIGYSVGYYYVTAEWPWQQDESAADVVLSEAQPLATAMPQRASAAASSATMHAASAARSPMATSTATSSAPTMNTAGSPMATAGTGSHALPATTAAVTPTNPVGQHGSIQEGMIHSSFMQSDLPYQVYLPYGYNDPAHAQQRYPVVYLLHGSPGNYKDWNGGGSASKIADALIQTGRIPPMILVMPDGQCSLLHDSEWANADTTSIQAESYLVREVVPFIDAHYRTIADRAHRAIGGLSSGGYGGVNIALHHPDMFGTAFGLSGTYRAPKTIFQQTLFATAASIAYNSPLLYIRRMLHPQLVHVYLMVGKQDKLDQTLQETQQMEQALIAMHVPHEVQYVTGGHSWHLWSLHLVDALEYFADNLPHS